MAKHCKKCGVEITPENALMYIDKKSKKYITRNECKPCHNNWRRGRAVNHGELYMTVEEFEKSQE